MRSTAILLFLALGTGVVGCADVPVRCTSLQCVEPIDQLGPAKATPRIDSGAASPESRESQKERDVEPEAPASAKKHAQPPARRPVPAIPVPYPPPSPPVTAQPPPVPQIGVPTPPAGGATPPFPVGACDAGGCWDTNANRYGGTGNGTYIDKSGRSCHLVGTMLQCF